MQINLIEARCQTFKKYSYGDFLAYVKQPKFNVLVMHLMVLKQERLGEVSQENPAC